MEKINLETTTDDDLLKKYKKIYQDKNDEQLLEYIHFQKLVS